MQAVGTIAKLAENVIGRTVHAVIHPFETLTDAAGFARDKAGAVLPGRRSEGEWRDAGPDERPAGMPDLAPPLPPIDASDAPGEAFETHPKAPSRNAEHGGPGDDTFDDLEPWDNDADVETPVGTTGAGPGYNPSTGETDLQQPGTEPLMDPSLTKQVKSEAETMRKAADPAPEQ